MADDQTIDRFDARILDALQRDGRLVSQDLADRANLSASQCARRRQRLENDGVIVGYRARVDPTKVGSGISAFIRVTMAAHSAESAADFVSVVGTTPSIVDCWTLTGSADYLLRVCVPDLAALNQLIQTVLLPHPTVGRVESEIVLENLKDGAPIPVLLQGDT